MDIKPGILVFLAFIAWLPTSARAGDTTFKAYLLEDAPDIPASFRIDKDTLIRFYAARDFAPMWFDSHGEERAEHSGLKDMIREQAHKNGLAPDDYAFNAMQPRQSDHGGPVWFAQEWQTSAAVLRYLHDIRMGHVDPQRYDEMIFTLQDPPALDLQLRALIEAEDPATYLQAQAPQDREYIRLREKLALYREIAERGGWPAVDGNPQSLIRIGDTHPVVARIRKRLAASYHEYDGALPGDIWQDKARLAGDIGRTPAARADTYGPPRPTVYDNNFARKVMEFQYFHGKKADGIIGPETLAALREPIAAQIDKILLAMERWRWLPDDLGRKHVRINLAGFYARGVENGETRFVMPTIIGQVAYQTPIFSSVIENVKIHPDWTSPDSISARYLIPKIQNNPAVVHRMGYQIQDKRSGEFIDWSRVRVKNLHKINLNQYQFRQKPGQHNALGLARFSIKNDYAIFMHGTPSVRLFDEDIRTFSSGCIRLENPLLMAHFLLKDQGMSKEALADLYYLQDGEFPATTYIALKEHVPVHLTYMTAWIDRAGHLHFADDIYGRDAKLKAALVNE